MRRSSKAVKWKRKVSAKKARTAVKRRAVPERMRSERRIDEVTHGAGPKMNDQSSRSDPLQHPDNVVRAAATATALAALQAWFLLPLRNLQSSQEVVGFGCCRAECGGPPRPKGSPTAPG